MLDFEQFLNEKYVSHAAYALNRLFAKLDPRSTRGDVRGRHFHS